MYRENSSAYFLGKGDVTMKKSIGITVLFTFCLLMMLAPACEQTVTDTVTITGTVMNRFVAVEGVQVTLGACAPDFAEQTIKSGPNGVYEFTVAREIPADPTTGAKIYTITASYGRKNDCASISEIPTDVDSIEQNLDISEGNTCSCDVVVPM
jgi:hypothetical protein